MASGFFALFDDIAALARMAAASVDDVVAAAGRASAKAAGVVVDDAAVTPRYVDGLHPNREISIIARIAKGSLRNKLVFILPALMVFSQYTPWLLTPLLMMGGTYLCFEGAEKIVHALKHRDHETDLPAVEQGPAAENAIVTKAVRTDFILSSEIMVISLNEVADEPFIARLFILVIVALAITALVYGVVALIVRMDDFGLKLASRSSAAAQKTGLALVKAMPRVMSALSTIGVVAMLWVGGHLVLKGTYDVGWHWLYGHVHDLEHWVSHRVSFAPSTFTWLTNTTASAVFGLALGALVVAVVAGIQRLRGPSVKSSH